MSQESYKFLTDKGLEAYDAIIRQYIAQQSRTTEYQQNITYQELKELRDSGLLMPGMKYRITDYSTIVASDTSGGVDSAGHDFDIIVAADNNHTLNENAKACMRDGDHYFEESKLQSWELKYCLDNDVSRFAWASQSGGIAVFPVDDTWQGVQAHLVKYDEDNNVFIWSYEYNNEICTCYSQPIYGTTPVNPDWMYYDMELTQIIAPTGVTHSQMWWYSVTVEGKGVIYYMKDEYGNEAPYDFKNIRTYDNYSGGGFLYLYSNIDDEGSLIDYSLKGFVRNNKILPLFDSDNRMRINQIQIYAGRVGNKSIIENNIFEPNCRVFILRVNPDQYVLNMIGWRCSTSHYNSHPLICEESTEFGRWYEQLDSAIQRGSEIINNIQIRSATYNINPQVITASYELILDGDIKHVAKKITL